MESRGCNFTKNMTSSRTFLVNCSKYFRTAISQNTFGRLLLLIRSVTVTYERQQPHMKKDKSCYFSERRLYRLHYIYIRTCKQSQDFEINLTFFLQQRDDIDVVKMMNSWVNQPGFPIVTFKWENSKRKLEIKQEKFVQVGEAAPG